MKTVPKALARAALAAALATLSACASDDDLRSAEQTVAAAHAQLVQDERSGNKTQIAADGERLNRAQRALSYLRLDWYGERGKGW